MPSIEVRHVTEGALPSDHGSALDMGRRQAWLRALEQAGLHAALQQTRVMAGSLAGAAEEPIPVEATAETLVARHEEGEARQAVVPHPAAPASRVSATENGGAQVERHTAAAERPQPLASGGPGCIESGTGSEEGHPGQSQSLPATASRHRPENLRQWPALSLLVLPSSDSGIEVWIRDASLTGVRAQMLLADLRRAAGDQGTTVARLTVNGVRLSSHGQRHADTRVSREE